MESRYVPGRRPPRVRGRRHHVWLARIGAAGSIIAAGAILAVIVSGSTGGGSHKASKTPTKAAGTSTGPGTAKPGTASVPILAYRVINSAPPGSSAPASLYVPGAQFSAQMNALKSNGWHAVTLDQVRAYWAKGTSLGPGKPIVISFDRGYASQYTNALPVLKQLGWVAVVNLQVSGLSPTNGGMTESQVHGLLAAGWELDTEGVSQADLTVLSPAALHNELTTAKQTVQSTYNVPVNWFSYPTGSYDSTVVAAVRAAGFVGATTLEPGWADPHGDRYRLARLLVVSGTTPTALLSQIAAAQQANAPPDSSSGTGTT